MTWVNMKSRIKRATRGQDTRSNVREKSALTPQATRNPTSKEQFKENVKAKVAHLNTVANVTEMLSDTKRDAFRVTSSQ